MANFFQTIGDFFYYVFNQLKSVGVADVLDILIVTVLTYYLFQFFRQRRAGKLALGIIAILLIMWISDLVGMVALNYLLRMVFDVGLIALIVIFQPELRSALEKMGGNFQNLKNITEGETSKEDKVIDELCRAVADLSASRTGALIVIEKSTRLGDEIRTGVQVDAAVTKQLIENIFYNKAPLHDGAMILRDGRIHACGCFLPLTGNPNLPNELGTRHRAGLGVSEISDALVIIVSEESGKISLARNGEMERDLSVRMLHYRLSAEFGLGKEKKRTIIKKRREGKKRADQNQENGK